MILYFFVTPPAGWVSAYGIVSPPRRLPNSRKKRNREGRVFRFISKTPCCSSNSRTNFLFSFSYSSSSKKGLTIQVDASKKQTKKVVSSVTTAVRDALFPPPPSISRVHQQHTKNITLQVPSYFFANSRSVARRFFSLLRTPAWSLSLPRHLPSPLPCLKEPLLQEWSGDKAKPC